MAKRLMLTVPDQQSLTGAVKLIGQLVIDKPVVISVDDYTKKRTREQNDFMWVGMLSDFATQAQLANRFFGVDTWHEFLKEKFLPERFTDGETLKDYVKWVEMPGGHLKMIGSTKKLTTVGFSNYLEKCFAFGCDLDVHFTTTRYE